MGDTHSPLNVLGNVLSGRVSLCGLGNHKSNIGANLFNGELGHGLLSCPDLSAAVHWVSPMTRRTNLNRLLLHVVGLDSRQLSCNVGFHVPTYHVGRLDLS
jgi:hypothetical protein